MMSRTKFTGLIPILAIAVGLSACSDSSEPVTSAPDAQRTAIAEMAAEAVDLPALDVDLPPETRPWDTSAVALVRALEAQDGHATVGFKTPGSQRMLATGRRSSVPAVTVRQALTELAESGAEVLDFYPNVGVAHVRLDAETATELFRHTLIDQIEPRMWYSIQGVRTSLPAPSASMFSQITPWGIDMVRANVAWSRATGDGAVVQIIDTGHDRGHEDLPYLALNNCDGYYDGCSDGSIPHGTHVFGTLTARDNTVGVVGVAPGVDAADAYVYAACSPSTLACTTSEIIAGIDAAATTWFDVLSMSLGGTGYNAQMATAVADAWDDGLVIVAAAGNRPEGSTPPSNFYPAEYSNVLGVSGVKDDGTFADSSPCVYSGSTSWASNYGDYVDIAGPFWALSTVKNDGYEDENDGWCGTSMATPHVAGAAALLREYYPSWSNQDIVDELLATANGGSPDNYVGHGVLDAAYALGIDPVLDDVDITGPTMIQPGATCTWDASVSDGTAPYSYNWYNEGGSGGSGTGSSFTTTKDSGNIRDHFTIDLYVEDSLGVTGHKKITVYEDSGAPVCMI